MNSEPIRRRLDSRTQTDRQTFYETKRRQFATTAAVLYSTVCYDRSYVVRRCFVLVCE